MSKLITFLFVLGSIFIPIQANADADCGFGNSSFYDADGNLVECAPMEWTYSKSNDGFSNYFSIRISPDDSDSTNTGYSDLEIFCDKKKIEVYVWVEYADSQRWKGSGQVRFDSGTPKKLPYILQKDFDGIVVVETKTFMQNLVKAKTKVAFKIPTVDGYEVLVYPKANLLKYRSIFSKSGCKF